MKDEYDFSSATRGKFFRPASTMLLNSTARFAAAEKKLREANFFLDKIDAARTARDPEANEAIDFYVSAFLSATRSVWQVLKTEFGKEFLNWCDAWIRTLALPEREAFDATRLGRNHSLKEGTQQTRQNYLVSGPQYPPELQFFFEDELPITPREFLGQISPADTERELVSRGRECLSVTRRMVHEFQMRT